MVKINLLAVLLWLGLGLANGAEISAYLTPKKVPLNESFQLVVEAKGDLDEEPDWQPLEKSFEIISNSRSQQISLINGRSSRSVRWTLTLMAKKTGLVMLPAIAFGRDRSPVLVLEVSKPAQQQGSVANGSVFVELTADKKELYLQQQLVLTVKLWRRINLSSATLSEPELSGLDAVLERLGEDREFEQFSQGERYKVIERRYAVFPQQSGTMIIEPITFQGALVERRGFFDPFAGSGRQVVKRSNGLSVEVKGIPASVQDVTWLPSRRLQLLESWPQSPATIRVGESLTRTVAIMAEGLTAAQLPNLELIMPAGLRAYPDQPILKDQQSDTGITGVRQQKVALVAQKAGDYRLPVIELRWWNSDTQTLETARLPERLIQVLPEKVAVSASEKTEEADTALIAPSALVQQPSLQGNKKTLLFWQGLVLFFALGWFLTLIFCYWRSGRKKRVPNKKLPLKKTAKLLKEVQKSAEKNQAKQCKTLLLQWAELQWPQQTPGSLSAMAEQILDPFKAAVLDLNRVLYRDESAWDGTALQHALKVAVLKKKSAEKEQAALSPLYPAD
ncbi:MAG: BatD family protein [Gammaproteobacteria bacterium]|nr:BatD family protein [Gammaproteobacteria bacterium]